MRILFIKLRHIGDSLLLTPTIAATKQKFPEAEIWVLVRKSCDGILAGCPEIDRILCTANPDVSKRHKSELIEDLKIALLLRKTRFDYVFELTDNDRGRCFAVAARTRQRCTNTYPNLNRFWQFFFHRICQTERNNKHQVAIDYACPQVVLGLPEEPGPLRFDESRMKPWETNVPLREGSFVVIHFHTRWTRKAWPLDRWERLINGILERTPHVVLSCGPSAEEIAAARQLVDKCGPNVVSTFGKADWSQLAWLLMRAAYFVGVDTAAMHLAAAAGCPTVCLFGPSPEMAYRPWRVKYCMIRPQDRLGADEIKNIPPEKLMLSIREDWVLHACWDFWTELIEFKK